MATNREGVWIKIDKMESEDVDKFLKKEVYFMKKIDIAFFILEIDFITKNIDMNTITINIPDIYFDFYRCESTIFGIKNDEHDTPIRVVLNGKKLLLNAYQFTSNTKYELNIQLFVRL